jgi:hypothetical protein
MGRYFPRGGGALLVLTPFSVCLLSCGSEPTAFEAAAWPEATALFQDDSRFLGADGAYSVDLGVGPEGLGRVLWMFGDTGVATQTERDESTDVLLRNSVALQTGYDPSRAFLRYYWRHEDGRPTSFVPEKGKHWFWPGHGVRLGARLLLFYGQVYQRSPGQWGTEADGWGAFVVDNPDAEPSDWQLQPARVPADNESVELGDAALLKGDHVLVYGRTYDQLVDDVYLARFTVEAASEGDLTEPEWWTGSGWGGARDRAVILGYAVEFSVHWQTQLERYVMISSAGAGATTLAMRTALEPQGPWSEQQDLLRPPESFRPGAFNYGAKAHPELTGADMIVTYVPSTFDPTPPEIDATLYHPYFARVNFDDAGRP